MKLTPAIKRTLAVAILLLTGAAFTYYLTTHPEVISQLQQTNPWLLAGLVAGYGLILLTLVGVQSATLRLIRVRMPVLENLMLTSYSSIANFFGPLQSGPGVRLVYLKARYHIEIKAYVFATFLYYGFFALISGYMLSTGAIPTWLACLILVAISAGAYWVIQKKRAEVANTSGFTIQPVLLLLLATIAQLLLVSGLYFAELRSLDSSITYPQALTYTGAANFAMFVSLTPGAIGFRESFLLFTQNLHGISADTVLAASLIDRAANVLFLGLLFVLTLGVHAKQRFSVPKPAATKPPHRD